MAYLYTRGDAHKIMRKMHQKYGVVVRVGKHIHTYLEICGIPKITGPNELSFNSSEVIEPIYAKKTMPRGPCK